MPKEKLEQLRKAFISILEAFLVDDAEGITEILLYEVKIRINKK